MSKKHYIVNCYTCQHNGQETCKGCRTLLVGEDEPYENWQLREDLEQKDNKIADLEAKLADKEAENQKLKNIVDGVDKLKQYDANVDEYVLINQNNVYADGHKLIVKTSVQDSEQVKKKLCDKIYKVLTSDDGWRMMKGWMNFNGTCEAMRSFLDRIQGEEL